MGYLDFCNDFNENDMMELQLDIIPIKKYRFLPKKYIDFFHINYNVFRTDYEINKNKIIEDIAYKLQFGYIDMPEDIKNADVLIIIERNTQKILNVVIKGFINKQKLKELYEISNNPYYICDSIKYLLEEGRR